MLALHCVYHWTKDPKTTSKVHITFLSKLTLIIGSASVGKTSHFHMSLVMRKPAFCICENKDADQLRGDREADQRLCFRYLDSAIPLLTKSEISSL